MISTRMQKLTAQEHVFLTENVLRCLSQNRIATISEFLQEDIEKLSIISTLSLPEVLEIKNHILTKYSAPLVSGTILLADYSNKRKFIPTYIESLDAALAGGIPVGSITELCGLAGSGKTQLCFQLAINCTKSECSVLYIDTKGDFSATRIQKILHVCGNNYKQMATVMSKIHVVHIWTLKDAIELLEVIKTGIIDNLGLIIIDSLPSLMFQHLGDDNKIGLSLLNKLVNNMRFISNKLSVAVVCVNIQTRWLDQEIPDIDDDDEPNVVHIDSFIERRNRCLGKYWQHIPSILLLIEKFEYNSENNYSCQIQIKVHLSRLPKQIQQYTLKLDDKGISVCK